MNITVHPHQWFHHRHMQAVPKPRGEFEELSHTAAFWIAGILIFLFVAAIIMTIWFGKAPATDIPPMLSFPY